MEEQKPPKPNQENAPETKTSYKSLAIILIVLVLILAGYAVYRLYFQNEEINNTNNVAEEKTADIGATISYLEGAVEYKESNGEWLRASLNDNLFEGYSVEIVGEGKAIINFDDGSAIRLNSDSGITLTDMDPNNMIITNDQGEIYSRVAKLERTFQIEAMDVVYESVGTAFVTINDEGEKGVEVFESSVKVIGEGGETLVAEGEKYYIEKESSPDEENVVKEITKEEVENDDFVMWNKEKDQSDNKDLGFLDFENKEEEDDADEETNSNTNSSTEEVGSIVLTGSASSTGVSLSWTATGLDTSKGFKILRSSKENPVYPGAYYVYLSKGEYKSYHWELKDGYTWHFRVCQYLGSECGVYSNDIAVTAPYVEEKETGEEEDKDEEVTGSVNSITLSDAGDNKVSWTVDGTSPNGFKITYSKTPGPTYPCRETDTFSYRSDPNATLSYVNPFDGAGTYYVRVCEYLGGKCGVYSNEISVQLTVKE